MTYSHTIEGLVTIHGNCKKLGYAAEIIAPNPHGPEIIGNIISKNTKDKPFRNARIIGSFNCSATKITSLVGAPPIIERITPNPNWPSTGYGLQGHFICSLTEIESLEGAPEYVGGNFDCSCTNITSLHNIHKQIKYIGGILAIPSLRHAFIKSRLLGVMLIKGLKEVRIDVPFGDLLRTVQIINRHLQGEECSCLSRGID